MKRFLIRLLVLGLFFGGVYWYKNTPKKEVLKKETTVLTTKKTDRNVAVNNTVTLTEAEKKLLTQSEVNTLKNKTATLEKNKPVLANEAKTVKNVQKLTYPKYNTKPLARVYTRYTNKKSVSVMSNNGTAASQNEKNVLDTANTSVDDTTAETKVVPQADTEATPVVDTTNTTTAVTKVEEDTTNTDLVELMVEQQYKALEKDVLPLTYENQDVVLMVEQEYETRNTVDNTTTVASGSTIPTTNAETMVKVYLYDFSIDMNTRTFPAGDVTFKIYNGGLFAHDFAIEGVKHWQSLGRNETMYVTTTLQPGTYKVFSTKDIDKEKGMVNYITVQ